MNLVVFVSRGLPETSRYAVSVTIFSKTNKVLYTFDIVIPSQTFILVNLSPFRQVQSLFASPNAAVMTNNHYAHVEGRFINEPNFSLLS